MKKLKIIFSPSISSVPISSPCIDLAMKYFSLLLLAIISSTYTNAQNVFMAYLKDAESKAPIIGAIAHIKKINTGAAADLNGLLEIGRL